MNNHTTKLRSLAQYSLFVSSYLPLFFLIIMKQVSNNIEYLHWGGFNSISFSVFITKFFVSAILILISIVGLLGLKLLLSNLKRGVDVNGNIVTISRVNNRNSEAISYIATYIIPFLFQNIDNWYEIFAILFLLIIIYNIYINSSLLLINPLLNLRYSIYDIEFIDNPYSNKTKSGLLIIKDKVLEEEEKIKIITIGQKLYFGINN